MNSAAYEELQRVNKLVYSIGLQQQQEDQKLSSQSTATSFSLSNFLDFDTHAINLSFYGLEQIYSHDTDHFEDNLLSLLSLATEKHCNQTFQLSHNFLGSEDEELYSTISTLFFQFIHQHSSLLSPYFTRLIFKHNHLSSIPFYGNTITHLDISHNEITSITLSLLPCTLQYLNLSYNPISTISFAECSFLNTLQEFYLEHCGCKELDHFVVGTSLQHLQLSHNQLTQLNIFTSSSSCQLKYLDASNNQLQTIPMELFLYCNETLEQLDLQENQLTTIVLPCTVMHKLIQVNLSHNLLQELPKEWFEVMKELKRIDLFHNQLHHLPPMTTHTKQTLEHISVHQNQLQTFPMELMELQWNYLYLQENQIESIPSSIAEKMSHKLEELDLFQNRIKECPSALFQCTKLKKLCLDENQLQHIPNEVVNLHQLQYFSAEKNPQLQMNPFVKQFLSSKK